MESLQWATSSICLLFDSLCLDRIYSDNLRKRVSPFILKIVKLVLEIWLLFELQDYSDLMHIKYNMWTVMAGSGGSRLLPSTRTA